MDREIKFRVWDERERIMSKFEDACYWFTLKFTSPKYKHLMLLQCTGLKDKNGKEIYEGDLISESSSDAYEVVWQSHSLRWTLHSTGADKGYREMHFDNTYNYEIIGNIYENPELLTNN